MTTVHLGRLLFQCQNSLKEERMKRGKNIKSVHFFKWGENIGSKGKIVICFGLYKQKINDFVKRGIKRFLIYLKKTEFVECCARTCLKTETTV